jgi:pilus assembly protein CpaB
VSRFGPGTMMALIFAILIGLGGAYVVREYLNRPEKQEEAEKPTPPKKVVPTAAYDLKPGRRLTLNDIIPLTYSPEEFKKSKYNGKLFMNNVQQLVGRMVKVPVGKGETFSPDSFWPDGTGPGVEHELSPGMVARTLPITAGQEILKFLSPGSIIDVLFRARPPAPSQTFTLLRGVKVLAIGGVASENQQRPNETRDRNQTPPSVTIEVSRYQAEWISVVRDRGDLEVVLRNRKYLPQDSDAASRLSMAQLVRLPIGIKAKGMSVYLGPKRQTMIFDRRTVYNDDLLIPTPIPRFPPPSAQVKPAGNENAKKAPAKK